MTNDPGVLVFARPEVESKAYLVFSHYSGIAIDPGFLPVDDILAAMKMRRIRLEWIILTHEHFDHCEGADALRTETGAKLVCSLKCNEAIVDPRKNLSAYYHQGNPFALEPADVILDDDNSLIDWSGGKISVLATPGHSPGSVVIKIAHMIFTGDTLLTQSRVPTHLPGGDKLQLARSHALLSSIITPDDILYPGHGIPQQLINISNQTSLKAVNKWETLSPPSFGQQRSVSEPKAYSSS